MTTQSRKETFTTSKGFKFTRTESGWLDETTGLEWDIEYKTNINQYDATRWASEQGKRLPTKNDFKVAEEHGIRELPEMQWRGFGFWSFTSTRYDANYACIFGGYDGNADYSDYRTDTYDYVAARCISLVSSKLLDSKEERLKKAKELIHEALGLMDGVWDE